MIEIDTSLLAPLIGSMLAAAGCCGAWMFSVHGKLSMIVEAIKDVPELRRRVEDLASEVARLKALVR